MTKLKSLCLGLGLLGSSLAFSYAPEGVDFGYYTGYTFNEEAHFQKWKTAHGLGYTQFGEWTVDHVKQCGGDQQCLQRNFDGGGCVIASEPIWAVDAREVNVDLTFNAIVVKEGAQGPVRNTPWLDIQAFDEGGNLFSKKILFADLGSQTFVDGRGVGHSNDQGYIYQTFSIDQTFREPAQLNGFQVALCNVSSRVFRVKDLVIKVIN
ncbi:MAG: hypothetical protein HRU19_24600 [Pseudobacteriovorax sp.]|nr:hypothetical protein [Pseudobacteriovorax sp.]